jgi:hypothetical protein
VIGEGMEAAAHPLVQDASEWTEAEQNQLLLRDQPPRKP